MNVYLKIYVIHTFLSNSMWLRFDYICILLKYKSYQNDIYGHPKELNMHLMILLCSNSNFI